MIDISVLHQKYLLYTMEDSYIIVEINFVESLLKMK